MAKFSNEGHKAVLSDLKTLVGEELKV